jgi:hypothetical protein
MMMMMMNGKNASIFVLSPEMLIVNICACLRGMKKNIKIEINFMLATGIKSKN